MVPSTDETALMFRAVVLLSLMLAGCDDIHHMLNPRPHPHRVHARPPQPAPAAPAIAPAVETHDDLIARKRAEADKRKRDWCDAHRDLTVLNGCELRR